MTIYAGKFAGAISGGSYTTKKYSKTDPDAGMFFDTTAATWWGAGQTSATYTNWPTVTAKSDCLNCHGASAVDMWTPWSQTAHATFFARGIEGITSNSNTCVACHTVGADGVNVGNGGYDDRAAAVNFVYAKKIGAWAAMSTGATATVAEVANIQCENCHGAQGSGASITGAHMSAGTGGPSTTYVSRETSSLAKRVSFSSDVCGACHASGTGHHNFSEWNTLDPDTGFGHSNRETAAAEGMNTSCARCHSAQGYTLQLNQLAAGNIDSIPSASINWNAATVEPQTCTACHDPHVKDASHPNQLRVYDSTPLLPAGFSVTGLGKGALCVSCHNSRNGKITSTTTYLHEDSQPTSTGLVNYNGGIPTSYSAPHQAAQGDVFMGRNAYFMGYGNLPMISKHANVEDACVGCHIGLNPQTHTSHGASAVSGHVFYIRDQDKATVCANCHSANVDGEALVANVESMLGQLATKLENAMLNRIITAQTTTTVCVTDGNTSATGCLSAVTPATTIALEEVHGQIGFNIQGFDVQLGSFVTNTTAGGAALIPKSDVIVRGGWNYFLIEGDQSKGIHNPSFATQVLSATTATVQ
jgi:hypothetical protein